MLAGHRLIMVTTAAGSGLLSGLLFFFLNAIPTSLSLYPALASTILIYCCVWEQLEV